jgi:hypothetical protein
MESEGGESKNRKPTIIKLTTTTTRPKKSTGRDKQTNKKQKDKQTKNSRYRNNRISVLV